MRSKYMKTFFLRMTLTVALSLVGIQFVQAQHVMSINNNSDVELESSPIDDEILEIAPDELMLRFSTYVRLVKLTLTDPDEQFVNIGFIYNPNVSRVFFLDLPELEQKPYYNVEWAAIDPENLVARGTFRFSFGPGAVRASTLLPEEEEIIPAVIVPDYRLSEQNF